MNAVDAVRRSETSVTMLKGAATQIEKARLDVLECGEDMEKAGDLPASRECRHIAGELLRLRERTEKLINNERALLKHLRRDEAKQVTCIHDLEQVKGVIGNLGRCKKCFMDVAWPPNGPVPVAAPEPHITCQHDWANDPMRPIVEGVPNYVCTKCGTGRA